MPDPVIPITKPLLDEREAEAARRAILSGWVTQGPEVIAFEKEFAAMTGAPHACAVSSCTTALHLALLALEIKPGDEVITVSHTYLATSNSIRYCGAIPVFVEIDPATYNLDIAKVETALTEKTRAILCVHQMGMPCDLAALLPLAKQYGLPVIEDAACAIGSQIQWENAWEPIGKPHGDIACFSFHPRKVITTGDGGMITTQRSDWDQKFRLLRQHGMSVSDNARHTAQQLIYEEYPILGYNYRMTDIQAAIGREQLKRLPEIVTLRRHWAERYLHQLGKLPGLVLPLEPAWAKSNWQSFCVRLPQARDQRRVMQIMLNAGVMSRRGIMCCHREGAYTETYGRKSLPVSEKASDQSLILPLYPQMTEAEQDRVISVFTQAVKLSADYGP